MIARKIRDLEELPHLAVGRRRGAEQDRRSFSVHLVGEVHTVEMKNGHCATASLMPIFLQASGVLRDRQSFRSARRCGHHCSTDRRRARLTTTKQKHGEWNGAHRSR